MQSAWLCVIISKNLCNRGEAEARQEIKRLTGDAFVDFRMSDDGFDGDCYCFVKCDLSANFIENYRRSAMIVTVLDSYENPAYLSDEEVFEFTDREEGDVLCPRYGDTVAVQGESPFSGLYGVVVEPGLERSRVMFRFHTVTKRRWLENEELILVGNVFSRLKRPVIEDKFLQCRDKKCPVPKEKGRVSTGKRNRVAD